jgi:general secretion pathway protein E
LRYRIDGVLSNITQIPKELHPAIVSRIKILSRLRIDEKRMPQDGRFEVKYDDRDIDLRVSTMPTTNDEKVVLRLLDKSRKEFNLEDLGLKGSNFTKLVNNIKKPYGMIVATGPTGSGKSTTLYAAISKINQPRINIITLEDPIEYELDGVSQSQAKPEIGFSFANGLRSVLRQDPDVIMVGEIRDKETAEMAIHAALTGHLLFSTLHTNDAAGAIPRLIDMGIEPFLISSASNVFLAQRLVRKICPHCKEKDPKFDSQAKKKIKKILSNVPESERKAIPDEKDWQIYKGKGCNKCYQGYKGRIGIFEVMEVNQKIRSMIHEDVSISDIRDKAIEDGMITMEQDGIIKALNGVTTLEEIFRVTGAVEEQF